MNTWDIFTLRRKLSSALSAYFASDAIKPTTFKVLNRFLEGTSNLKYGFIHKKFTQVYKNTMFTIRLYLIVFSTDVQ